MCKCVPDNNAPYCGKPGCEWPHNPSPAELRANTPIVLANPETLDSICQHIAMGGNLAELCRMWHVSFWDVSQWLAHEDRAQRYKTARLAHSDFMEDRILLELKRIAFVDIREAYNADGDLKQAKEMPETISSAISSIDVDEIKEWDAVDKVRVVVGHTKKLKLHSKLDALKMLGDFRGMWKKADIGNLGKTLEDLIVGSQEKPSV